MNDQMFSLILYRAEAELQIALHGSPLEKVGLTLKSIKNDLRFKVPAHEYQLPLAYST